MLKDSQSHMLVEVILKDYKLEEEPNFNNGSHIGLHQVGRDNSKGR